MQSQDKRVHIAHFLLIKLNEYCDYNVDMHETVEKHLTVKGSKLSSIRGSIIDFTLKCNLLSKRGQKRVKFLKKYLRIKVTVYCQSLGNQKTKYLFWFYFVSLNIIYNLDLKMILNSCVITKVICGGHFYLKKR